MISHAIQAFRNPGNAFRGAPFWAWNCRLDREELLRQIDIFEQMGLGGFMMHARVGLDTPYLGDEFMALVRVCCERAAAKGMKAWLFDEDRWASGAAGGLVTRDERYGARALRLTLTASAGATVAAATFPRCHCSGAGTLLARYAISLREGRLAGYRRLALGAVPVLKPGESLWHLYYEMEPPIGGCNGQSYVDTLNPEAIRRFIELTHERYLAVVGNFFGGVCPGIFTDEPTTVHRGSLTAAEARQDIRIPFTDDFPESFAADYGVDILEVLPEIFWELPGGATSVWRYRYHEHTTKRFAAAFSGVLGEWCGRHGIAFTGHFPGEQSLGSQTGCIGEAMRNYRSFQIPGVDNLGYGIELNTLKQAQSVARQDGRAGLICELYGVTNWNFDFAGHKRQGDWQAALGVLYRVQHLAMVSMKGEAKRDYPASIGYQSPWHGEYRVVEDHFARLGSVLSRGAPVVRIGVVHPIESFWLCCGPLDQTGEERQHREGLFAELSRWLLHGFNDFDFISESLLPDQDQGAVGPVLAVGAMRYEVVLVPQLRTIRATTLARLERFADAGGTVLFLGAVPDLVDAEPSDRARRLAARTRVLAFDRLEILRALKPWRGVQVLGTDGTQLDGLLHQLRQEGDDRYLFICNTELSRTPLGEIFYFDPRPSTIAIDGAWQVTQLDTHTGTDAALAVEYKDGRTLIPWEFLPHGSALFQLSPGKQEVAAQPVAAYREAARLAGRAPVTLAEPNVLLLDFAAYQINAGAWNPPRYILDLNRVIPEALGRPWADPRKAYPQPWVDRSPVVPLAEVRLRLTFRSEVAVAAPALALEDAETTQVLLDGTAVPSRVNGYFTDRSIRTIPLPAIAPGEHILELVLPFTRTTSFESLYLLGDFGVRVAGREACLIAPVRDLAWGNIVYQGLPFYGGNLTYHCTVPGAGGPTAIHVPHFAGALVTAALDGGSRLPIAFAPYRAELGALTGKHALDLTLYGNRGNCFGQVHSVLYGAIRDNWWAPDSWILPGDAFVEEYRFAQAGILAAPVVEVGE